MPPPTPGKQALSPSQVLGVSSAPGSHGRRSDTGLCPWAGPQLGEGGREGKVTLAALETSPSVGKSGPNGRHLPHGIPEQGDSEGSARPLASWQLWALSKLSNKRSYFLFAQEPAQGSRDETGSPNSHLASLVRPPWPLATLCARCLASGHPCEVRRSAHFPAWKLPEGDCLGERGPRPSPVAPGLTSQCTSLTKGMREWT